MADLKNDIRDDEFRVLGTPPRHAEHLACPTDKEKEESHPRFERLPGTPPPGRPPKQQKRLASLFAILLLLGTALLVYFKWPKTAGTGMAPESAAPPPAEERVAASRMIPARACTQRIDTVINDIPLSILIPHNAVPELTLGTPDQHDPNIILAARAADIREDNQGIVGEFILKGNLLSRGVAKKGFCAIIDGKITIGMAESTPLFEEAINQDGYFFRQYALVSDGVLINSGPKGKSLRRALCTEGNRVFVVLSQTPESFHDFSQALTDLGVQDAIYLCGGASARGWYRDEDGTVTELGEEDVLYKNETFILWRIP